MWRVAFVCLPVLTGRPTIHWTGRAVSVPFIENLNGFSGWQGGISADDVLANNEPARLAFAVIQ